MAKRRDGKDTRRRLFDAASEVFARKGYKSANVAEICKFAGANVASVNYYFSGKESLYKEAYLNAVKRFTESFSIEVPYGSSHDQLRNYIRTLIENFTADGELGRNSCLYLMEMINPSGLINDAWHDTIAPVRRKLHLIIRESLGADADEMEVRFCEFCIFNQCSMLITRNRNELQYILGAPLDTALINRLTDHIANFSLAGIKGLVVNKR